MPRKPRIVAAGIYHHVVHRGIDHQPIYRDACDKQAFLRRLTHASKRHHIEVLAFCLMDNHYHLLLLDYDGQLSSFMAVLNGSYTSYFNVRHRRDGALLRGRFFSIPSDSVRYALCVFRYIHLNPVAAGMVATPVEYVWSSHRQYVARHASTIPCKEHMLILLASVGVHDTEIDRWVRNPLSTFEYDLESAAKAVRCGDQKKVNEVLPPQIMPDFKGTHDFCVEHCTNTIRLVADNFGLRPQDLTQPSSRYKDRRTTARYVAAFLCFSEHGATYRQLAQLLQIAEGSVGVFVRRGAGAVGRGRQGSDPDKPDKKVTFLSGLSGSDPSLTCL